MKRYLLLATFCLAALSCTQETNFYLNPEITSFVLDADGGSFDEMIFTNGIWSCTVSDDAAKVTPDAGSYTCPVHIEVAENTEMFTKSIRIRFTSSSDDGLSRYANVVLTQACHPFLFCEEPDKTIGPEGGQVRFSINSNKEWRVEPLIGGTFPFGIDPMTGGPNRTELTLDIPANDTGEERHFLVYLSLLSDPDVTLALTVDQEA